MEITKIIIILLGVILVLSLVALLLNKNIRQKLHLPGISWVSIISNKKNEVIENSKTDFQESSVNFGKGNTFENKIQNVAGRDISATIPKRTNQTKPQKSFVNLGKRNKFKKNVKNIAGRDIITKN